MRVGLICREEPCSTLSKLIGFADDNMNGDEVGLFVRWKRTRRGDTSLAEPEDYILRK